MKIGLLTRNYKAWCSTQLIKAIAQRGFQPVYFQFPEILGRIACTPKLTLDNDIDVLGSLKAILVRPIGRGSLDEIIFRLDLLHRIERGGIPIINSPSSIEKAVDKYYALTLLEENNIPVPKTIVTENPKRALEAFYELGSDVVIKPIFGSRGVGVTRVTDAEVASRIFRSLAFVHHVLYVQEFVPHKNKDIRAFVIGQKVIAAMNRIAQDWKTNVSQGAKVVSISLGSELEDLAIKAAQTIGCEIAGIDILEGPCGYYINEINSQPGFKALQSISKVDIAGKIIDHLISFIV